MNCFEGNRLISHDCEDSGNFQFRPFGRFSAAGQLTRGINHGSLRVEKPESTALINPLRKYTTMSGYHRVLEDSGASVTARRSV